MRRFGLAFLFVALAAVQAAIAAETITPPPPAPTCGKTVAECQKAMDGLNDQLADLRLAYGAIRQQRDSAQQQLNDAVINNAIQQQQVARQKAPAK